MAIDKIFALFGGYHWAIIFSAIISVSGALGSRLSKGRIFPLTAAVCLAVVSLLALFFLIEFRVFLHGDEAIFAPLYGQKGIDVARNGIPGIGIDVFYMKSFLDENYWSPTLMTKSLIFLMSIYLSFSLGYILTKINGK